MISDQQLNAEHAVNPYVTVNVTWVDHWHGYLRMDPDTLKVTWRMLNTFMPDFEVTGECETGLDAYHELDAAHRQVVWDQNFETYIATADAADDPSPSVGTLVSGLSTQIENDTPTEGVSNG